MCVFNQVASSIFLSFSTAKANDVEKGNTINGEWEKCGNVQTSYILRQYLSYGLIGLRKTRKITVQTCSLGAGSRICDLPVTARNANR